MLSHLAGIYIGADPRFKCDGGGCVRQQRRRWRTGVLAGGRAGGRACGRVSGQAGRRTGELVDNRWWRAEGEEGGREQKATSLINV